MAINYNDIKNKFESEPFNKLELELIQSREDYIDNIINDTFGNYGSIQLESYIIEFSTHIKSHNDNIRIVTPDIKKIRRNLMTRELMVRYEEAGWNIEYDIDNHCYLLNGIEK